MPVLVKSSFTEGSESCLSAQTRSIHLKKSGVHCFAQPEQVLSRANLFIRRMFECLRRECSESPHVALMWLDLMKAPRIEGEPRVVNVVPRAPEALRLVFDHHLSR